MDQKVTQIGFWTLHTRPAGTISKQACTAYSGSLCSREYVSQTILVVVCRVWGGMPLRLVVFARRAHSGLADWRMMAVARQTEAWRFGPPRRLGTNTTVTAAYARRSISDLNGKNSIESSASHASRWLY